MAQTTYSLHLIQKAKLKNDTINISEKFINNVSINVLKTSNFDVPENSKDIFLNHL